MRFALIFSLCCTMLAPMAQAQRGGDRGGGGGERGGGGGGFPTRGGGGFPTRGGGEGGGGFPTRGGGGTPGRGGDTGGRGGFDPSSMLSRFDTNKNGSIEPSEAQGPAQFFLQRLAQSNPKIDLKKPIPISMLTEAIQSARGGGGAGGGTPTSGSQSDELELLVPGFTMDFIPEPLLGFGAGSEMYAVRVEERDMKESEERMRRYDSNKDGKLDARELRSGRWSDDPMSYDRNRDGFITKSELAVRYAKRRVDEVEKRAAATQDRGRGDRNGWQRGESRAEEEEKQDRFGDAKSYRLTADGKTDGLGLPGFFSQRDSNNDGQVMMEEYSSDWTAETLGEFMKWDVNADGIIEPRECLAVLKSGGSAPASKSSESSSRSSGGTGASPANMEWAKRMIGKYDGNGDGQLTQDEWSKMIIKPTKADYDQNGVITVDEYARYRGK